jgi:hypothetical protein
VASPGAHEGNDEFVSVFTHLQVDHALSYLIALVIPALDAIFPVLPGCSLRLAGARGTGASAGGAPPAPGKRTGTLVTIKGDTRL